MSERAALISAILDGQLDAAGAFADWLEENGEVYSGVLLRRRWQRWQKERVKLLVRLALYQESITTPWANLVESLRAAGANVEARIEVKRDDTILKDCDEAFERYV